VRVSISGQWAAALALLGSLSCAQPEVRPAEPPAPESPVLAEGAVAPDGEALGPDERPVRLSRFRGKPLVLYFYPVDFGSSGTAEAEELKKVYPGLHKLGVALVGVSTDEPSSHRDFIAHFQLPFLLLSDRGGAVARAFGVPLQAGTTRHFTFFIDRHGVIRKVWRNVRAWGHAAEVLAFARTVR
jgi:peroxiredoxin Q/BCP